MAVTRQHTDTGKEYNPNQELSNSQRQRFSEIANRADEKREQREIYLLDFLPQVSCDELFPEGV